MMKKNLLIILGISFLVLFRTSPLRSELLLSWHDCIIAAKKNNPDLASARERYNQARAATGITRSAMLPQISTGFGSSVTSGNSGKKSDSYSYGISGKQILFDGMQSYYDLKDSGKKSDVSLYEYRVAESNLRLSLRNAFILLLKSQESHEIKKEIAGRRKQNFNLVKLRYDAGREHIGSLLTAKADLAQAEFDVSQSMRNILLCQRLLAREMGMTDFTPLTAKGDFNLAEPGTAKPDMKGLVRTNPLLIQMIHLMESAEYGLKSARAGFSPRVYGTAAAGKTGGEWPPKNREMSAGLEMSFSLFEGGRQFYEMSRAEAALSQASADVRSVRGKVFYTLEQKWTQLQNAREYVGVQSLYLKAAEERSRIASAQYSVGLIAFDSWVIIEANLVSGMNNYLEARSDALMAEAEWIQAKGETLDYDK